MSPTDPDITPVEIPEHLRQVLGEPDPGTRMYRQFGTEDDYAQWWDAVCEICGEDGSVSPGGVSMYARVSRAGVHKRMKEGRLTAFLFHVVKGTSWLTRRERLEAAGQPYIYIPGQECRAWADLLQRKPKMDQYKEAVGDGDYHGRFLIARGRKVKKQTKGKGGKDES